MFLWVTQFTVICIILIFLIHYLFNFFKSTLTVPKLKDLVNTPSQKYENMYNIIQTHSDSNSDSHQTNEYKLMDLLPQGEREMDNERGVQGQGTNMKNELKNFLKKQLQPTSMGMGMGTDIASLDSMNLDNYQVL